MTTVSLQIDGMMCDGCVRRVEKLLARAGAQPSAEVSIGSARVEIDESSVAPEALVQALESAGYRVRLQP